MKRYSAAQASRIVGVVKSARSIGASWHIAYKDAVAYGYRGSRAGLYQFVQYHSQPQKMRAQMRARFDTRKVLNRIIRKQVAVLLAPKISALQELVEAQSAHTR